MKVIIPAKSNSNRVKNKNYRNFHNNDSLVDILIKKLLRIFKPSDIYLSCDEDKSFFEIKYNIKFILRDKKLCDNDVAMGEVISSIVKQMELEDDEIIMWALVTDPFFFDYRECVDCWNILNKDKYDSLGVLYEHKGYVLDYMFNPINCGFADNHIPTQYIKPVYKLNNTLFIASVKTILEKKYYLGERPFWLVNNGFTIDIDSEYEFKLSQKLYGYLYG